MNQQSKDFNRWNELKRMLHNRPLSLVLFKEGDIWWCSLGLNIGSEQDGKNDLFERPVLVLARFNNSTALVVPITSKIKNNPYHVKLSNNSAIISQMRLVSMKRFQRFVESVSDKEFKRVKLSVMAMLQKEHQP